MMMKKAIPLFLALMISVMALSACGGSSGTTKVGEVRQTEAIATDSPSAPAASAEIPSEVQTVYYVGDILQDGNMKIVYMSSGVYVSDNQFMQPDEGKQYIYLQFAFENTSDKNDASVSFYSFKCYADGYAADMFYGGENDLSATLSAGRSTMGYVYFSVPVDATDIEVEYEANIITNKKITFVYEGEKDSGYVFEPNSTATEGAYVVGDIVESDKLRISYLSCEEYVSDNMFIQPTAGYHYISCEFEFENLGTSDAFVSYYDFDCYADGADCSSVYSRDDALSATISSGRKAKGTVTFEVPTDASVVEVEYRSNLWTSDRVVFSANA